MSKSKSMNNNDTRKNDNMEEKVNDDIYKIDGDKWDVDNIFRSDDTTLNAMGNSGRKNVEQKFNVEKMCFSTYSEYKKLINA